VFGKIIAAHPVVEHLGISRRKWSLGERVRVS
jgi:hypothetical protein